MILTDKAKEHFLNNLPTEYKYENSERGEFLWLGNEIDLLDKQYESLFHALIIEWFDYIGYHIEITYKYTWRFRITDFKSNVLIYDYSDFESRQEAINKAIKKANEIYNNQNK